MRTRAIFLVAALGGATTLATPASATLAVTSWNFTLPTPPGTPTNFEVYLPGDQTGYAAANYNGFAGGSEGATYNPTSGQTVVSFQGSSGFGPLVHFGFTGVVPGETVGGERLAPVAMHWSYPGSSPVIVPVLGINLTSSGVGTQKWFVLEIEVASPSAPSVEVTNWFELPYQGSYSYSFVPSGGTVSLSDAQFFTTDTLIPLDQLNENLDPSTYGGTWAPLPNFVNGTLIAEPTSLALLGAGLAGIVMARRRTTRRAA